MNPIENSIRQSMQATINMQNFSIDWDRYHQEAAWFRERERMVFNQTPTDIQPVEGSPNIYRSAITGDYFEYNEQSNTFARITSMYREGGELPDSTTSTEYLTWEQVQERYQVVVDPYDQDVQGPIGGPGIEGESSIPSGPGLLAQIEDVERSTYRSLTYDLFRETTNDYIIYTSPRANGTSLREIVKTDYKPTQENINWLKNIKIKHD